MAAPTITNGEEHFFPIIYEGNGTGQRVGKFVPFTDNGTIANSLIFNRADNPYMHFNKASITPDSDKIFTFSCWFKIGEQGSILNTGLFNSNTDGNSGGNVTRYAPLATFTADGKIFGYDYDSGGYNWYFSTNRTFEDTSKWYHFVLAIDTTQSTSTDRMKVYIDGDQITSFSSTVYPSLNQDLYTVMAGGYHILGLGYNAKFDGYIAEVNLIENQQLTPSTFGVTDSSTGRWVPKALTGITYGTNGFRLQFGSSSNLGDDTSGNTNDFSVANLVAADQTTDSPTQNHNTFGSSSSGTTLSEGNLTVNTGSTNGYAQVVAQPGFGVKSGKWYWEVKVTTVGAAIYGWKDDGNAGGSQANTSGTIGSAGNFSGGLSTGGSGGYSGGSWYVDHDYNNEVNYTTVSTNDVLMFAMDLDTGKGYCGKNGTWFNSANPANGTGAIGGCHRANGANKFYPCALRLDSASVGEFNFGQKSFAYTAPTGFSALQQDNMPETAKGVTGMVWIKNRDEARSHVIYDSSRGPGQKLQPDKTNEDTLNVDGVTKFLKGGVAVGEQNQSNDAGDGNVAWNWTCNGGTTETNNDGETTVTLQKNTTAGFSIGTFTSKVAAQTCGHGLGATPEVIILKRRDGTQNWMVYHKQIDLTDSHYLHLNATDAEQTGSDFGNTLPTSTVFTTNVTGTAGRTYCFWAWTSIEGYSKFGKYKGNGSSGSDAPFIYTGFQPAMVMVKSYSNSATNWEIRDNLRSSSSGGNPITQVLYPNLNSQEYTTDNCDFLSNGFKWRSSGGNRNESGYDYIYMAFAKNPFVGDGTNPVTAR